MSTPTSTRPHGYARYRLDGCRCNTCGFAVSEYDRNRQRQIIAGTWRPFVDTGPVREHLHTLTVAGIGTRRVADLSGVPRSAIGAILYGRRGNPPGTKVRADTAEAILAVTAEAATLAAKAVVDGTGTTRRIRALCRIGWTLTEQARHIGWTVQNYSRLAAGGAVTADTARLVGRLYDQLSMTPTPDGPSATRARTKATAQGWAPPLAWDDDTIDDPDARPRGWTGRPRTLSFEDFVAAYRTVDTTGKTNQQLADELGLTLDAFKSRRYRAARAGGLAMTS